MVIPKASFSVEGTEDTTEFTYIYLGLWFVKI